MLTGVLDADGVDELVEEAGGAAPELEDGDALGAGVVRKELDEVRYRGVSVSDFERTAQMCVL